LIRLLDRGGARSFTNAVSAFFRSSAPSAFTRYPLLIASDQSALIAVDQMRDETRKSGNENVARSERLQSVTRVAFKRAFDRFPHGDHQQ
jgi:hypothetical protein